MPCDHGANHFVPAGGDVQLIHLLAQTKGIDELVDGGIKRLFVRSFSRVMVLSCARWKKRTSRSSPSKAVCRRRGIGIGDEDLSEAVVAKELQQVTHALRVDLVEDIIQ